MDLSDKKIWFDVEEPKTAVMFKPLFEMFQNLGAKLLITARDYDSTFQILDDQNLNYYKIGKHGGEKLEEKLQTYIQRLQELFPHVKNFTPHYFITFSSVEGARIAYGLKVPSIGFNDEPRNEPVCKLILPFLDNIITPQCVPLEWYVRLGANPDKIIRYNGIDEIAWLSDYSPNPQILENFDLERGKYVLMRSEPSFASYFIEKLKPEETMIRHIFPSIFREFPSYKYFLLVRTEKQEMFLKNKLASLSKNKNVVITRYLPNLVDLCFYSGLIISGGGTIVRESSLLNKPSIEFFPGESAPQEHFLIDNGFPLEHIKDPNKIIERSIQILQQGPSSHSFDLSFREKVKKFENPNKLCFDYVKEKLNS